MGILKRSTRFYKKEYITCKNGKPDYCYAFIENAIQYLDSNGKMVYLVPNSIYKNVYAQNLRKLIKKYLVEIKDYPNQKLFDNAMTSSTIMFLRKGEYAEVVDYNNVPKKEQITIAKKKLYGKWIFESSQENHSKIRFGDLFQASMAIATQRNKVFVVNEAEKNIGNWKEGQCDWHLAQEIRNMEIKNILFSIYDTKR